MTRERPADGGSWPVVDSLPDPHVLVQVLRDESGDVTDLVVVAANPAARAEYVGGDPIGTHLLEAERCWQVVARTCLAAIEAAEPFERDEVESQCTPERRRWLDVRGAPVGQEYVLTWRDVTPFTDEVNATRASQNTLRQALDALPDPYALLQPVRGADAVTTGFTIVEVNEAAADHAGMVREDLIGEPLADLVPRGAADFLITLCAQVADEGLDVVTDGAQFPVPAGTEAGRQFDVRAVPVGPHVGLTWRDVTERETTMQRLHDSEEHYRILADNATDIVFRGHPDASVQWVSPSVRDVLGFEPESLLGKSTQDLMDPDDRDRVAHLLAQAQGGDTWSYRARFLTAAGESRWMAVNLRAVLDGDSQIVAWVGSARDIHDAHLAQLALRESEARFRLLAETTSDVVYQTDADGAIVWMTESISPLLGWNAAELIGTPATGLVAPEDLPKIARIRPGLYSGHPGVDGMIVRARTATGNTRFVSVTTHALRDDTGAVTGLVAGVRDVDALVQATKDAEATAQRLAAQDDTMLDPQVILETIRDDAWQIIDFRCTEANRAAGVYLQRSQADLVGRSLLATFPGAATERLVAQLAGVVRTGRPLLESDWAFARGESGATRWFDLGGARLGDGVTLTWRDVTERFLAAQALAESEQRYRLLAENSSDIVLRVKDGLVTWASPSVGTALGGTADDWVGLSVDSLAHPEDRERIAVAIGETLRDGFTAGRGRIRAMDGSYHWTDLTARSYLDADGGQDGLLASLRIVDDKVAAEEQLQRLARFDDLTGVWKRGEAVAQLTHLVGDRREPGRLSAVLFIDLDYFKTINDTSGHAAGDEFLIALTDRIRAVVRRGDLIARLGGDEFLVIIDQVRSVEEAEQVADKIRESVRAPVLSAVGSLNATASIGVTLVGADDDVDLILARADAAMYQAKHLGRDRVVVFEDMPDTGDTPLGGHGGR